MSTPLGAREPTQDGHGSRAARRRGGLDAGREGGPVSPDLASRGQDKGGWDCFIVRLAQG